MNNPYRTAVAVSARNKHPQPTSLRHYAHGSDGDESDSKKRYPASRSVVSVESDLRTDFGTNSVNISLFRSQSIISTKEYVTIIALFPSKIPVDRVAVVQKFIFLKAAAKESVGGASAPPYRAVGTVSLANTQELAKRVLGGGPQTPSPASQQTAVSGWVLNPRLTATCCETSEGVVASA